MTQDEVLSMARDAGMEVHPRKDQIRIGYARIAGLDSTPEVMRFAALVAAKAVAEEREACAQACDECRDEFNGIAGGPFVTEQGKNVHHAMAVGAQNSASAIRARGTNAN